MSFLSCTCAEKPLKAKGTIPTASSTAYVHRRPPPPQLGHTNLFNKLIQVDLFVSCAFSSSPEDILLVPKPGRFAHRRLPSRGRNFQLQDLHVFLGPNHNNQGSSRQQPICSMCLSVAPSEQHRLLIVSVPISASLTVSLNPRNCCCAPETLWCS